MYSILSAAIVFYISFAVETILAADDGYIVAEINIPCEDPTASLVSRNCLGYVNYKIADFSKTPFGSNLSAIFDTYKKSIDNVTQAFDFLENKQCSDAGRRYFCEAAHPLRCDDDYVKIDVNAMQSTCSQGVEFCSGEDIHVEKVFNCSALSDIEKPGIQLKFRRTFSCVDYPALNDDPFTCEADYKVFSDNATELSLSAANIVVSHKLVKSSITDKECQKTAAKAICEASLPACSADGTKVVALLSKEKCREMVGCVNKTNNANLIMQAHDMCSILPHDKNATKYPLTNVFGNNSSPAMVFSTIFLIATLLAQVVL